MRYACTFLLLLGVGFALPDDTELDVWSRSTIPVSVPSADGMKRITMRPGSRSDRKVVVEVGRKRFATLIGYATSEVLWAPDSNAFVETHSEGGAVGDFVVALYYVSSSGIRTVDPTRQVKKDFMHRPVACGGPREEPNLAAVRWGEDSGTLFVAAEIQPHSVCDSMGTFRLYEISLPSGRVLATWDQLRAKREFWNSLGMELRNSDDDCIRDPVSCYVPQNHLECFPKEEKDLSTMPAYCPRVREALNGPN